MAKQQQSVTIGARFRKQDGQPSTWEVVELHGEPKDASLRARMVRVSNRFDEKTISVQTLLNRRYFQREPAETT